MPNKIYKYIGCPILTGVVMKREGCDMRGFLSFQVLWLLSRKRMTGEALARELGRRRGEKPKAGTIYPALKDLREKELIEGSRSGKEVSYALTQSGRKEVRRATLYFCRCFGDVFQES